MKLPLVVISPESNVANEQTSLVKMFEHGLEQFHVRKPSYSEEDMINYLNLIPKQYYKYVIIHSHFKLAETYGLKGIQVGCKRISEAKTFFNKFEYIGYSAHSLNEIKENRGHYTHFFLSPIYTSISKKGYISAFSKSDLIEFLKTEEQSNIIALGGLTHDNVSETISLGFNAVATIGSVWNENEPTENFIKLKNAMQVRPFALSIAGFDPSSGAGITADIKTFEQFKVQGLGVTTAITYQNDSVFESVDWLSYEQITKQLDLQLNKYPIKAMKIGLVESFEMLKKLVAYLKQFNEALTIIWDPILKASAGFNFHEDIATNELIDVLKEIDLITPNIDECKILFKTTDLNELQNISKQNNIKGILLKGGHRTERKGTDVLIQADKVHEFDGRPLMEFSKHGTGCVLSSAIAACVAQNKSLVASIEVAKEYVADFIESNSSNLGYHNI